MSEILEDEFDQDIRNFFANAKRDCDNKINEAERKLCVQRAIQEAEARTQAAGAFVWLTDMRDADEVKSANALAMIIQAIEPVLLRYLEVVARDDRKHFSHALQNTWLKFWRKRDTWPCGVGGVEKLLDLAQRAITHRIMRDCLPYDLPQTSMSPQPSPEKESHLQKVIARPSRAVATGGEAWLRHVHQEFPDLAENDIELFRAFLAGGVTLEQCQELGVPPVEARGRLASLVKTLRRRASKSFQHEASDTALAASAEGHLCPFGEILL